MDKKGVLTFILFMLIIASCSPEVKPTLAPETASWITPKGPIKEAWQEQWENILSHAKKEGKVVVYGTLTGETTRILGKAFKEKYDIGAEFIGGRGAEMAQKILTERKAGLYLVDLWLGGAGSVVSLLKPANVLDPLEPALILPEVADPKMWLWGILDFVDQERTIFPYLAYAVPPIAININLVKPEDIKTYRDLLHPRWKGKIVMQDPTTPGTAQSWFYATLETMGLDFMYELAGQEPVITGDRRLQVEWLAHGKYPIAIAPQSDILGTFEREGAPVKKHMTREGTFWTSGSGNVALINNAPHPNAARLFITWLLGKEAQTLHSQTDLLPSARIDVPKEHVDPFNIIKPGIKYINGNTEDFRLGQARSASKAREIFGHLMR